MLSNQETEIIEAAKAILNRHLSTNPVLSSYDAAQDYCQLQLALHNKERFHCLFLDKKNRLIEDVLLATGTVDHVPVYPREVLRHAIRTDASAVILTHNHPSGDPTPSPEDISMTEQIRAALHPLNIPIHTHIIVTKGQCYAIPSPIQ